MRKNLLLFSVLFHAGFISAQSILKTMKRLPDTGETTSYTETSGEDADISINVPFFIQQNDGTVLDTVTGLLWQKTDGGEMTITQALLYADTSTLAGYTDWRLPHAHEGFSILNHQFTNPALNTAVFTSTSAEYWWTSDRQLNDTNKVWATNAGGGIGNHPKSETHSAGGTKYFHARLVRDVNPPLLIDAHFTDNGDGTTTDHLTELIWQKIPVSDSLTWEQALQYADTLTLANETDWRLPNIKELQSINEESRMNPSLNGSFFTNAGFAKYWSSTTLPNQTSKAWYLDTRFGITTYALKTSRLLIHCVRSNTSVITAIPQAEKNAESVYAFPNPFSSTIQVAQLNPSAIVSLYSSVGQLIYRGNALQIQDFSHLTSGHYWLFVDGEQSTGIPLIKK